MVVVTPPQVNGMEEVHATIFSSVWQCWCKVVLRSSHTLHMWTHESFPPLIVVMYLHVADTMKPSNATKIISLSYKTIVQCKHTEIHPIAYGAPFVPKYSTYATFINDE